MACLAPCSYFSGASATICIRRNFAGFSGVPRVLLLPALSSDIRLLAGAAFALAIVILVNQVPVRTYRWSEEMLARKEIGEFLRDDAAITQSWQSILDKARQDGISFDELAGRIDTSVADRYEESFELLSELPPNPALPSAATVEILRHYAERRRDASRALAEGLRANKPEQIRDALEMEKQSRQLTQPEKDELSRPKRAGQDKDKNTN